MSQFLARTLKTVGLLVVSNTFMTVAWYGHLKHKSSPLLLAILVSWGIALFEYMFQVPANRIGSAQFSLTQLKVMQECITLAVFIVYALVMYRESLKWNTVVSMLLVVAAVYFAFIGGSGKQHQQNTPTALLKHESP
jgi:uncharacterized protein (DUF486 family)